MPAASVVRSVLTLSIVGCLTGLPVAAGDAAQKGAFAPASGRYEGSYTGGAHGAIPVKLRVGQDPNSGAEVVKLEQFSAIATCGGGIKRPLARPIVADRHGRFFSRRITALAGTLTFSGSFTSQTALTGTVRATTHGGSPSQNCDTGNVTFRARRVAAR